MRLPNLAATHTYGCPKPGNGQVWVWGQDPDPLSLHPNTHPRVPAAPATTAALRGPVSPDSACRVCWGSPQSTTGVTPASGGDARVHSSAQRMQEAASPHVPLRCTCLPGQRREEASRCFPGPPVNVTCNIFINSFGSVTETTMVRVSPVQRAPLPVPRGWRWLCQGAHGSQCLSPWLCLRAGTTVGACRAIANSCGFSGVS